MRENDVILSSGDRFRAYKVELKLQGNFNVVKLGLNRGKNACFFDV